MSKRKFVHLGRDVDGNDVFHSTDDKEHVHLKQLPSGKAAPLGRDLMHVQHEKDGLYNIETVAKASDVVDGARSGPAQVATEAYREGWDRVFGGDSSSVN